MNNPNLRHDWDGIRAGNTLRWLEQTGPRYVEMAVKIIGVNSDGAHLWKDDTDLFVKWDRMSFASERVCVAARDGDVITLKVRRV